MRRTERILIGALAGIAVWFMLDAHSQTETIPSIQWGWQDGPILRRFAQGRTLEFGLRSDGVVVWRETVAQTNSPAENLGVLHRSGMRPQIVPALTNPPPLPR